MFEIFCQELLKLIKKDSVFGKPLSNQTETRFSKIQFEIKE